MLWFSVILPGKLKQVEKFAFLLLFRLNVFFHLFQNNAADIAVQRLTAELCTVLDQCSAALGKRHVDSIIVCSSIFVVGANFCVTVFLLHFYHPRQYTIFLKPILQHNSTKYNVTYYIILCNIVFYFCGQRKSLLLQLLCTMIKEHFEKKLVYKEESM